ncbi:unnamed protein product [Candidula unifasciata]|uniref:Farnesyl pyrophosphate synthase n=1 Tax=Candidula unifasciata TaxID=100452 RepID=A0A8S3Z3S0_9EUPU|nr:unnamed protein product [Candidula unifasciata]
MAQNVNEAKPKSSTELAKFDALFPELVGDLTKNEMKNPEIADAFIWFKEVLHYNVPFGEKTSGVSVVTSYKHLVPQASEADMKIARVLGWCIELLQACSLIMDDVEDNSVTRRGRPCWYKKEEVGLTAVNDASFLECTVYSLLKKYIRDKPYYLSILELFLQTTCQTVTGQCLDLITGASGEVDFSKFTMERYSAIVKWKTGFHSFYLPVAVAMHMAGISDDESHAQVMPVLLQMGHFYQIQNDYLDCYGAPEITGKVGTDIQDNKCSWLIVKALEIASDEQKEALKLNLEDIYKQCEENSYQDCIHLIYSMDSVVPKTVFLDFVNMIYKR